MMAMLVHSLGDFNLQMPATGWVLAAMVAIPLARDKGSSSVDPAPYGAKAAAGEKHPSVGV